MVGASLQIWILGGALGVVMVVLGFLSKDWFKSVVSQLKSITEVLQAIRLSLVSQEKDIEHIKAEQLRFHDRLNDHGKRIGELEREVNN